MGSLGKEGHRDVCNVTGKIVSLLAVQWEMPYSFIWCSSSSAHSILSMSQTADMRVK